MSDASFLKDRTRPPAKAISWRRRCLGILFAALPVLAAGCSKPQAAANDAKVAEVIVTTPITDEVMDYQDFTGRMDALKTVDIRARVSGYVKEIPFKEGDEVHEGDLLFLIDPDPYQADLNQAVANLKTAEADLKLQRQLADRAQRLVGGGSVSKEEYDQAMGAYEKSQATIGAMQAARDRAQLYLNYTRVIAPISGRISRRLVDPGNLIKADDTMLTTIVTEDPLYAYFDVDERTYLELVGAALAQTSPSSVQSTPEANSLNAGKPLPVLMRLANEEEFTRIGRINFVDNRVVATTGTIRMRGLFDNPKKTLKPGLFVRIRLPIGQKYQAVLIADEAIQSDQGRKYVFVVNDKNEVVYRPVTLGQGIHGLRVIKEGLKAGERVIISGMQRVRPKMTVQAKMQDPPKPPHSLLTRVLDGSAGHGKS
jgi:RND family efflux transporter MFP subunit